MIQVQDGLFAVEETMPCLPKAIGIGRHCLPATLGRMETEEAAARILHFSKELDQWVGVSWFRIVEMMRQDFNKVTLWDLEVAEHVQQMRLWYQAKKSHFWACVFTLGIYALFVSAPKRPAELGDPKIPLTGIYTFGPEHIVEGIQQLAEQKMLTVVTEGEGSNAFQVFFPTPALIERIMKAQGVAA